MPSKFFPVQKSNGNRKIACKGSILGIPAGHKLFYDAGKFAAQGVEKAKELAEKNHLEEKAMELKKSGMKLYEENTGRNASLDGTVLKYTGVATVAAVALSTAPAVLIGTAVAGAAVAVAGTQQDKATKSYTNATGRDGEKDKTAIVAAANTAKTAIIESATQFKQGFNDQSISKNFAASLSFIPEY